MELRTAWCLVVQLTSPLNYVQVKLITVIMYCNFTDQSLHVYKRVSQWIHQLSDQQHSSGMCPQSSCLQRNSWVFYRIWRTCLLFRLNWIQENCIRRLLNFRYRSGDANEFHWYVISVIFVYVAIILFTLYAVHTLPALNCSHSEYLCMNTCLPYTTLCDGTVDCHSDEHFQLCAGETKPWKLCWENVLTSICTNNML